MDHAVLQKITSKMVVKEKSVMVIHRNVVYLLGGIFNKRDRNTCEKYDIARNVWEAMSNGIKDRSNHIAVVHNKIIYVAGGVHISSQSDNLEKYYISENKYVELKVKTPIGVDFGVMISISPQCIFLLSCKKEGSSAYRITTDKFAIECVLESVGFPEHFVYYPLFYNGQVHVLSGNYYYIRYDSLNNVLDNEQNILEGELKGRVVRYKSLFIWGEE